MSPYFVEVCKVERTTVIRLMFSVAVVLSTWNCFSDFIYVSFEGAWEGNTLSLIDIAGVVILETPEWLSHYLEPAAVAAFLCGGLPLITGLLGLIRPGFKGLVVVSTIVSVVAVISVVAIYRGVSAALYGLEHTPIVSPGLGTYITFLILAIEISAGVIALRKVSASYSS